MNYNLINRSAIRGKGHFYKSTFNWGEACEYCIISIDLTIKGKIGRINNSLVFTAVI